jgi:flagellar biosynthesis/type III secretory pathway protein FliH
MFDIIDDEIRYNGTYVAKIKWLPAAGYVLKAEIINLLEGLDEAKALKEIHDSYNEGYAEGYEDGYSDGHCGNKRQI